MIRIIPLCCIFLSVSGGRSKLPEDRNPKSGRHHYMGGSDIDIADAPYQVAIEHNGIPLCGGVLISKTHVLTAAQCLYDDQPILDWKVRVGSQEYGKGGTLYDLLHYDKHPDYRDVTDHSIHEPYNPADRYEFDVAVIELTEKVSKSKTVQPIKIIKSEPEFDEDVIVNGWDYAKNNNDEFVMTLMSGTLKVLDRRDCKDLYKNIAGIKINKNVFCAFTEEKGLCYGDQGGAAVIDGELAGIASGPKGCATESAPGIFVNLAEPKIRTFIRNTARV